MGGQLKVSPGQHISPTPYKRRGRRGQRDLSASALVVDEASLAVARIPLPLFRVRSRRLAAVLRSFRY